MQGQLDAAEASLQGERTSIKELRAALTAAKNSSSSTPDTSMQQSLDSLPLSALQNRKGAGTTTPLRSARSHTLPGQGEGSKEESARVQELRATVRFCYCTQINPER
jgi:hypothetical protein